MVGIVKKLSVFLLILLFVSSFAFAESPPVIQEVVNVASVQSDCLYYFYGIDCDDCKQVEQHLTNLEEKYPRLELKRFEVYVNRENYQLLKKYFESYSILERSQGLPIIFIGNSYFVGVNSITTLLEGRIKENTDVACPTVEGIKAVGFVGDKDPSNVFDVMKFSTVTRAGLTDGYKRGQLALLVVLLVMILAVKNNDQMFKKGIIFVIGVYIAYFLFGIGWFTFMTVSKAGFYYAKIVGLTSLFLAFLGIKGFFRTWKIWFDENFKEWEIAFKKFLEIIFSPAGALIMGFLAAFFSFSDLGYIFLSMRGLLQDSLTNWQIWPLMLYYVFTLVLHPLAITFFLYFARDRMSAIADMKAEETKKDPEVWRKHVWKVFRFIISIIMLVLGLVLIFI